MMQLMLLFGNPCSTISRSLACICECEKDVRLCATAGLKMLVCAVAMSNRSPNDLR